MEGKSLYKCFLMAIVLLSSCTAQKKVLYLQDVNANSVRLIGFNVPFNRFLEICEQSFGKEDELWLELNKIKENQNQK